jgi:hypothetical protein
VAVLRLVFLFFAVYLTMRQQDYIVYSVSSLRNNERQNL